MVGITKTLLLKKELTYGTDAAPTAAANAALTRNFRRTPLQMDNIERNLDVPTLGGSPVANTNARETFSYELELAGSGAAGTAAAWMEHLEGCGMVAPILTAATDAKQKFAAAGAALSSVSAYSWRGDQKLIGLGARGSFGFNFTAGAYPFLNLSFVALVPAGVPLTDANPGAADFTRWQAPVEVNTANTQFMLDGYAAKLQSLTAEIGAQPAIVNLVGENSVRRGNHAITGQIVIKAPKAGSEKDYFTKLRTGGDLPIQLIHGLAAGNIVQLDMAHCQLTSIEEQDAGDDLMYQIGYRANVSVGQDDLVWTVK
jgi:hypothetical protein